jgi:plasmid stability protein
MAALNIKNFPDALYEALKARAESRHRSIAQEATHLLAEALVRQEPLSILDLQGVGKELWSGIDAARHVDEERASWD